MRIQLVPVGTPTRAGNIYTKEAFAPHFQLGSQFLERIKNGSMLGEITTPRPAKHDTTDLERFKLFATRVKEIRHDRVCLQITDATLEDDGIYGMIKPIGPYGSAVQGIIDRGETPAVGMRSFTRNLNGVIEVAHIITFDLIPPL